MNAFAETPAAPAADDVVLLAESFAGAATKAGEWTFGGTGGGQPCLTAATGSAEGSVPACGGGTPDPDGSGVLRLTGNQTKQSGFVLANTPLTAHRGANIEFDMYQYDASGPKSADGIGFFIIDGEKSPTKAGAPGNGLGYQGLEGAVVGVGFDDYGNFSNAGLWNGDGKKGAQPNNIVVRGAADKYAYVTGKKAAKPLAVGKAKARAEAKRHAVVSLSTTNVLSVSVDYGDGPVKEIENLDLDNLGEDQPKLPKTFKVGFAASTGGSTAVHEVSGLRIRGLKPNLQLKTEAAGPFTPGAAGGFTATVSSTPTSGPTYGPVKVTVPVTNATVTGAAGEGWDCQVTAAEATCTRPGTDADTLAPGTSYPPIKVDTAVAADATGEVVAEVTAATDKEFDGKDNTIAARFPIEGAAPPVTPPGGAGPNLGLKLAPEGEAVAGKTGVVNVGVANAAGAKPTAGKVTVDYDVPKGTRVTDAAGSGWECATERWNVSCSREDALAPGASYPPIALTSKICRKFKCTEVRPSVKVTAEGDTDLSDNTLSGQAVPLKRESALKATVEPGEGGYTVTVANEGPSDEPNGKLVLSGVPGLTWKCDAPKGSACPAELEADAEGGVPLYVAGGATITLKGTGTVPEGGQLTAAVTPQAAPAEG